MAERSQTVRVAIIDNSINPLVYRPVEHWSRYLFTEWEAFTAREGRFPRLSGFSHVILTGSEASILERDGWVEEEACLVREAVRKGLAVLGSCWGHQLLAYALSGPSHVGPCAKPEIGWIPLNINRDSELIGPAGMAHVFSIHFDEVRNPEGSFEVLASTETCPVQAMRLKGKPVWGLQCHPEVDPESASKFLQDLLESGFKGPEHLRRALETAPVDSGLIRRIVPAFLRSWPGVSDGTD